MKSQIEEPSVATDEPAQFALCLRRIGIPDYSDTFSRSRLAARASSWP